MNAVEIEQAITDLAVQPFDAAQFPYAFLEAFGNKATTLKRLRAGASNKSDLGGVLQTSNIHAWRNGRQRCRRGGGILMIRANSAYRATPDGEVAWHPGLGSCILTKNTSIPKKYES